MAIPMLFELFSGQRQRAAPDRNILVSGYNSAPAAGEMIGDASAAHTYLTSAAGVRIKAGGNVADDVAGTGARTVVVHGLDANYAEISDELTTAGAGASSPTVNEYLRLHAAYIETAGSGGQNAAAVVVESSGGVALATIPAPSAGISLNRATLALYTVPAGQSGLLSGVQCGTVTELPVGVGIFVRPLGGLFQNCPATVGGSEIVLDPPIVVPEKTDIEARAGGTSTHSICRMFITLLKN